VNTNETLKIETVDDLNRIIDAAQRFNELKSSGIFEAMRKIG
jgi:hypothetical protein